MSMGNKDNKIIHLKEIEKAWKVQNQIELELSETFFLKKKFSKEREQIEKDGN